MSWYSSRKDAEEAVKWKEKEYGYEFYVLEDNTAKDLGTIYWAQRKQKHEFE